MTSMITLLNNIYIYITKHTVGYKYLVQFIAIVIIFLFYFAFIMLNPVHAMYISHYKRNISINSTPSDFDWDDPDEFEIMIDNPLTNCKYITEEDLLKLAWDEYYKWWDETAYIREYLHKQTPAEYYLIYLWDIIQEVIMPSLFVMLAVYLLFFLLLKLFKPHTKLKDFF